MFKAVVNKVSLLSGLMLNRCCLTCATCLIDPSPPQNYNSKPAQAATAKSVTGSPSRGAAADSSASSASSTHPATQALVAIYPNLLRFIATMHNLWTSKVLEAVPGHMKPMLAGNRDHMNALGASCSSSCCLCSDCRFL